MTDWQPELTGFERGALEAALRKMFRSDGWLSVSDIDKMLKVAKVTPPKREYDAISVLHCVHWNEMTPAVRDEAAATVLRWFGLPQFDPFTEAVTDTPRSFIRGLLGKVS